MFTKECTIFFFYYHIQIAATSHVYKVMAFCPDCVGVSVFTSIIETLCAGGGC